MSRRYPNLTRLDRFGCVVGASHSLHGACAGTAWEDVEL